MWCHTLHCLTLLVSLNYMAASLYHPCDATHCTVSPCYSYHWTTELFIFTVHVMPHIALSRPVTHTTELKKAANIYCPCDATRCSLFLLLIPQNPKVPNLYWPGTRRQAHVQNITPQKKTISTSTWTSMNDL